MSISSLDLKKFLLLLVANLAFYKHCSFLFVSFFAMLNALESFSLLHYIACLQFLMMALHSYT